MAKVEYGSFTVVGTGPDTIILNDDTLNIESIVLFIADSSSELAAGYSDGTTTYTGCTPYSEENSSYSLTFYKNVSGTKTKVLETVVTNLDVGEFSIDTTTLASSKQIRFVVYGS